MKLLVGLGNPGDKYENTRHNVGFKVADALLKKFESAKETFWEADKKGKYHFKKLKYNGEDILLVKPQTFMNNSGFAVAAVVNFYKIKPEDMIVIYDDLDLPLGKIRIRFGGGAGGHRGVESIIEKLRDDKFLRVRLGIGRPTMHEGKMNGHSHVATEDYVIAPFDHGETGKVRSMIHKGEKNVLLLLENGIEQYMSKYNKE